MKQFQSFEDFERILKNEPVPSIDLDKIKAAVITPSANKVHRGTKRFYLAAVSIILIMSLGVGAFAAINKWQLKNKNGDVILEYGLLSEEDLQQDKRKLQILARYEDEKEKIKASLADDEAAIFIIPEAYEIDKSISIVQNSNTISNIEDIKNFLSIDIIPPILPDGFSFYKGSFTYKLDTSMTAFHQMGYELYEQAKAASSDYIFKIIPLSKDFKHISMVFHRGKTNYISISSSEYRSVYSYEASEQIEEILNAGDTEVLLIQYSDRNQYMFKNEDTGFSYNITSDSQTSRDDVLKLINGILSK